MIGLAAPIDYDLSTGDIVLYSGRGSMSEMIRKFTFSKWSHVGMVINHPEFDLAIWESTISTGVEDLESGCVCAGVKLVRLQNRIANYTGAISIRKLMGGTLPERRLQQLLALKEELNGKRYETSNLQLAKAIYDGPLGLNREDLTSIFCSELVAKAYQCLGLLPKHIPCNEYTPADFSQKKQIELLGGFYLSDEIPVKTSRKKR